MKTIYNLLKIPTIFGIFLLSSACLERPINALKNTDSGAIYTQSQTDDPRTTIVFGGTIHTVDTSAPTIDSFAYANGKITAIAVTAIETKKLFQRNPRAKRHNLNGATLIPGLIDAHGHLLGLGQSLINVDLMGTSSKQDIIERLKKQSTNLLEGQWLLGRGWDQNDWPGQELPTAQDLDQYFPNRPVWLERVDGHASWGNSMAMAVATRKLDGEWQPQGGEIVRDKNGNPSGVFIDKAANLIQSEVPAPSKTELSEALDIAMKKTASVGLTAMHDAGTSLTTLQLLSDKLKNRKLNIRVYAMADGANETLEYLCSNGPLIDPASMLTARSIKLYSDGALGSRGAALLSPYSDAPNNVGLLIESEETLKRHAITAADCGLQVNIHAIGDRGNQVTLNVLETIHNRSNNLGRHRIEHSQVIAPGDFNRFKRLNLIASVQPTHATSDMYWAEDRVGKERIKGAYAWQTFIGLGIPLALGSDFPVERASPLLGFYAAVSRKDTKGWPANGWYPTQVLSRQQALYGFTQGAAYAAFQEDSIGSISVGKYADFVILSDDIMSIPEAQILNTKVLATYLNGKAIYKQ